MATSCGFKSHLPHDEDPVFEVNTGFFVACTQKDLPVADPFGMYFGIYTQL